MNAGFIFVVVLHRCDLLLFLTKYYMMIMMMMMMMMMMIMMMMMMMMMMMRIDAQGFEPAERENQAEGHVDGPGSGASRCELCALFDLYHEMVLDEKNTDEKKNRGWA